MTFRQYTDAAVGVSVAPGSPCTPFHVAVDTGVVKSAGSITMVWVSQKSQACLRTQSVGATCQNQSTKHAGLFFVSVCRVPSIQIFLGQAPAAIMSRHISCARAQQPSSG